MMKSITAFTRLLARKNHSDFASIVALASAASRHLLPERTISNGGSNDWQGT